MTVGGGTTGGRVPLRQARFVSIITAAAWAVIPAVYVAILLHGTGTDARIIHAAWDGPLYEQAWQTGAFIYSPAIAQVLYPATLLSFEAFFAILTAASVASVLWCAGPRLGALLLLTPPVLMDLQMGNFNVILGAAMVAGLRRPEVWAFVLLTKVTPGIGLLWFVVRREWRQLAHALGATLAVVAVSALIAPDLWAAWIERVLTDRDSGPNPTAIVLLDLPLWLRLGVAAGMVAFAAWRRHEWLLVLAGLIAQPAVTLQRSAMLVAMARSLVRSDPHQRRPAHEAD